MNRLPSARTVLTFTLAFALCTCNREEPGEQESPIAVVKLPTPKTTVRAGDHLRTAEPMSAHTATPLPLSPTKAPAAQEAPAAVPTAALAAPAAAVSEAQTTSASPVARTGVIGKGTDLLDGASPDSKVLGTFEGRTEVDVLEARGQWTRVRAPVIGGTTVEGWVASAAVKAAGEKPPAVAMAAPAKAKAAAPAPPAGGAKAAAPAAPAKAAGKGPDNIVLAALAGMEGKKPGTPFTHKKHYEDYSVKCEECHHAVKAKGGAVPATKTCTEAGCHQSTQCNGQTVAAKNKACPFFEDAFHFNCIECHRAQSGPTKCGECHTG
jgi:hypothetical protein